VLEFILILTFTKRRMPKKKKVSKKITNKKTNNLPFVSDKTLRGIIDQSVDGIMVSDTQGNVAIWNNAMEIITGLKSHNTVGLPIREVMLRLVPEEFKTNKLIDQLENSFRNIFNLKTNWKSEIREQTIRREDGTERVVQNSSFIYRDTNSITLASIMRDITERKNKEQEAIEISFHDHLTGLYNRRFLEEELERLDNSRRLPLSIITLDVDGLKIVNDTYGHLEGDSLLKEVANVLTGVCRSDDIIARMGGDEFTILLPNTSNENAKEVAKRLTQRCKNSRKIIMCYSIGVATKAEVGQKIVDILKEADDNMYRNKSTHKSKH
jgi:diguanylate cyclase (GGDEF)-like protein/PAS domain S-box-containing protein